MEINLSKSDMSPQACKVSKNNICMDNTNEICMHDACIKQDGAFDTNQMFNFTRDECRVCGDNPVCCYFEGISCRACFDFFKRTIKFKNSYWCKQYDRCPIYKEIRAQCQSCRFKKCLKIGMNPNKV